MKGCFLVTCAVTGTVARKGLILPTACVLGVVADVTAGAVTLAVTVETAVETVLPLLAVFSTLSPAAASSFFSSTSAAILRWICGALMAAASAIGGVLMVAQCRGYDMMAVSVVWRDGRIDAAACWRQRTPLSNRHGARLSLRLHVGASAAAACWRQRTRRPPQASVVFVENCRTLQYC
jgi:hypothetical protein